MIPAVMRPVVQLFYENRNYRFWLCQLAGWSGYSLATFLSITLIEGNVTWPHVGHIGLSAVLGMLTTWPLRRLYHGTLTLSLPRRLFISVSAVIFLSALWNVLRILVFAWLIGKEAIWDEFNDWYFGSLSIFLSWTVLYYGIEYYDLLTLEHQKLLEESSLKREEQLGRLQAEASARDAQLQMLRYQLNPHFLFNTLNSINALVKLNENSKAGEMIQQLSEFLRHTLDYEGINNVSLSQELESLMLYLDIEKTRFEDRLNLDFDIEPQAHQALVPSLILQPLVENSMKHAISNSEDGGTVRISARVQANELELEIADSGPGMKSEELIQGRGIGLRNTRQRLEALFPNNYTFKSTDGIPSGVTIQIRIPYQTAPLAKLDTGGDK